MSDTGEEWQVARRRKGAAKRTKVSHQVSSPTSVYSQEQLDIEKTVQRIRDTVCELRCEEVWLQWREQLLVSASGSLLKPSENEDSEEQLEKRGEGRLCQQCVCYGLGSFSSCVSARYQLAMLLLILEAGQIAVKDCSVYDPAFSCAEKDVLRELGLTVLTENEEGKRLVTKPTLFYLMHCGKALYNNLLWRNWTIERELQRDYMYISKAVDLCQETQLACPSRMIDVFSDTAVITFPFDSLCTLPQSTWAESPEPMYQHCPDLEIILKENRTVSGDG